MDKEGLRLVVDNSEKKGGESENKNKEELKEESFKDRFDKGIDNEESKEESFKERFDRGIDNTPVSELDFDREDIPENVRNMIQNDLKNIQESAESFDDVYQKMLSELKAELQALRDLVEGKKLTMKAQTLAYKSISETEQWISGMEKMYDSQYMPLSDDGKATFAGQEMRDATIRSFGKVSDSVSALENSIASAPSKNE